MKLPVLRTSSLALAVSLLSVCALLTGCTLESTAPSVASKVALGKISGNVHGGRQPIAGANVYVYSPTTTGYGGVNIAPSLLNLSTSLLTNAVPSSCGAGAMATAAAGVITLDPLSGGITTVNVTMQGAGYTGAGGSALAPTVSFTDPTGKGATAIAVLNSYNGLSSITLTNPGEGYTAPVVTITPASTNACTDSLGNYYVSSDANGNFSLSGDYSCTSGLPVYVYTTGGDAGGGTTGGGSTSSGVALMSILGICGATSGPGAFGPSTFLGVSEVSTVAAAYATAGFATDPTHIGVLFQLTAPTTLVSSLASLQNLELAGLTNAFLTASNLVGPTGVLQVTPNGNGTVPYKEINTLGNILASCVNSEAINDNCETLASDTGNAPNTAAAAIYIAQHPASNVANLYKLTAGSGLAFQPTLTAAPSDWTVSIGYTGAGLTTSGGTSYTFAPRSLSVDASGNVWEASAGGGNILSGFTNLGVPLASAGYTGTGVSEPTSATIDAGSANIWLTDLSGNTLSQYNVAGNSFTTITPYTTGTTKALSSPIDAEFDGSGNIWVANPGNDYLVKLTSAGAYTTEGVNTSYVAFPISLAAEPGPNGNIWEVGEANNTGLYFAALWTNTDTYITNSTIKYYDNFGVTIDASGNAWVAAYSGGYLSKIPAAGGTATNYTAPKPYASYTDTFISEAIDGAGNVWLPDVKQGLLYEYSNTGTLLSGTYGFVPGQLSTTTVFTAGSKPSTGYTTPYAIAVDGSGNVWYSVTNTKSLYEMVGASTPVVAPLAYGTANTLLGQAP